MGDSPYLLDQAERRFEIVDDVTSLGRSGDADVHIADRRASRRHAEILWDGETCLLRDLGSTNGTYHNQRRAVVEVALRDGDVIQIAGARFTFRDPGATIRDGALPRLVVEGVGGEVWVDRQPVSLSPKERALFDLLWAQANEVCSKQAIAEAVWPEYEAEVHDYQIESLVKRLREKLEPDPRDPILILTQRGWGYKLVQVD